MLSLLEIYQMVRDRFLQTPLHSQYVFSLHDVAHTVHGVMLMSPRILLSRTQDSLDCVHYGESVTCEVHIQ